jgi:hypothetical protein
MSIPPSVVSGRRNFAGLFGCIDFGKLFSSSLDFSSFHSQGHVWTAPGWQGLSSRFAALVGAAMCPAF